MSQLPVNASEEEIQNEVVFLSVLIASLDPESSDYDALKAEHEHSIQELETRLHSRRADPQTPSREAPNLETPWTGQSFDLPARPRGVENIQHATQKPPIDPDASGSHSSKSKNDPPRDLSPARQDSLYAVRKRRRHGSVASDYAQKSRRTSEYVDTSGNSTPTSLDSLDEAEQVLQHTHGLKLPSGTRSELVRRMEEQQRKYEERIKMERDDAEFARRLEHESLATPPVLCHAATQSTLGTDGQVERARYLSNRDSSLVPNVPQSRSESFYGSDPSTTYPTQSPSLLQSESVRDNRTEDDLREITSGQFSASLQRGHHPQQSTRDPATIPRRQMSGFYLPPRPHAVHGASGYERMEPIRASVEQSSLTGRSNNPSVPGAWPGSSDSRTVGRENQAPSSFLNVQEGNWDPLQPVRGNWMDEGAMFNRLANGDWDSHSPTAYSDDEFEFAGPSREPYPSITLGGALHARGLDYMLNDPRQSKEDLENLLKNIRPDDEIAPDLRVGTPKAFRLPLLEHQKLGLTWLRNQEEGSNKGGILADDMGLGKTIQALALIVSRPSEDPAKKTTLILAPVSLLKQWEREVSTKLLPRHALKVYIYHGQQKRNVSFPKLATYDIVLTTFGTVAAEWNRLNGKTKRTAEPRPRENNFPLLGRTSKWYRIIVDEAQCIKNKATKAAQAACQLVATHRICMTGTPMMNNVGELYSLIHFLRIPPYNILEKFNHDFKKPLEGRMGPTAKARAMRALQALLKAILLRRTKSSQIDGKPILNLPERVTEIKHAVFSDDEQSFYTALETQTQLQVNRYLQAGKIGRNYSYILVRLLRLRQACCHPHLIKDFAQGTENGDISSEDMEETVSNLSEQVIRMIKETDGNFECPVCYDGVENPTMFFPCGHDVCSECFTRMTDPANAVANGSEATADVKCPECRTKVETKKVFTWKVFKKVHMPEQYHGELGEIVQDLRELGERAESDIDDDGDDDETDDEIDDESDANSQGDLNDFIVPDDSEVDYESEIDEERDQLRDNDDEPGADNKGTKRQASGTKWKGKGKKSRNPVKNSASKDKGKGKSTQKKKTLAQLKAEGQRNAAAKKKYLRRLRRTWVTSAKVDKTLEILQGIYERDPSEKTIIFSQFTSLLDLLEIPIDERGYRFKRYDGSMSAALRNEAVAEFMDDPRVTIILVSLKAGNAGLNLNAASQVIILDPFWNPMIEEQAIDRAHRIGQSRKVEVHRVLVAGTVEDRIIELQEKKREMISQALDEKAAQSLTRLGRAELAYLFGITSRIE